LCAECSSLPLYSHGTTVLDSQVVLDDPSLLQLGSGVGEEHCFAEAVLLQMSETLKPTALGNLCL
jgi:hypothetical protein